MDMNTEPLYFHGSNPYQWDTLEFPGLFKNPNPIQLSHYLQVCVV